MLPDSSGSGPGLLTGRLLHFPRNSSTNAASGTLPRAEVRAVTGPESGLHSEVDAKHPWHIFPPARYMHIRMHSLRELLYRRKEKKAL